MAIKNYGLITSIDELREYTERIHGNVFGFDIETGFDGPDREKFSIHPETALLAGISFTDSTNWARYVPLGHNDAENLDNRAAAELFWDLLATGQGVAHNALFELRHLSRWFTKHLSDDPVRGEAVRASRGYFPIRSDTMIEAYLVAQFERFGLKPLTKNLFDHTMTELGELFPDLAKNKQKYLRFNTLPLEPHVIEYACEDAAWCLAIHELYYPKMAEMPSNGLLYGVEMAIVTEVLPLMEDEGIVYDWPLMRRKADELRIFRDRFNAEIMKDFSDHAGEPVAINLASPPQVRKVLFDQMGLQTSVYTDRTRELEPSERVMSTGTIALTKLAQNYTVVKKILQWREMTKLLGTYLDKYETKFNYADDGRAHPSHLSAFVITGRFAVSDPPYQGSPKKYHFELEEAKAARDAGLPIEPGTTFDFNFRDVIKAPPMFYILGFDLSQAELRAVAGEAQEHALLDAFENGEDVHRITASLMLGIPLEDINEDHRDVGKTMNFALLYGLSAKGLADRLGIPLEEAQALMDKYFSNMPAIAAYMAKQIQFGRNNGYVQSKFGRHLPIWEYKSDKRWIQQKGDRACVNYPIQGAATGDLVKIMMVRVVRAIKDAGLTDKIKLVMNVHDALEFYVHKSINLQDAIAILKGAVVFPIPGWPPMKADWHVARRWGTPTKVETHDDGSISVAGERYYDMATAFEQTDEGDVIEVMPEVSHQALHEAAQLASARHVVVTLSRMPDADNWKQFKSTLKPGSNTVTLVTPAGSVELPETCALSPGDLAEVSRVLGDPNLMMGYRADAAAAELTAGLTF